MFELLFSSSISRMLLRWMYELILVMSMPLSTEFFAFFLNSCSWLKGDDGFNAESLSSALLLLLRLELLLFYITTCF